MSEQPFGFGDKNEERAQRLKLDPSPPNMVPPPPTIAPVPPPLPPKQPNTGHGVNFSGISMLLGLVGILLSPFSLGIPLGAFGVVLGILHLVLSKGRKVRAVLGVVFSVCAIAAAAGQWYLVSTMLGEYGIETHFGELMGVGGINNWTGVAAPDFEAVALDGKKVRLADYRGRRLVIHVFSDWGDTVQKDAAHLDQLVREHPDVAALAMDAEAEDKVRGHPRPSSSTYPVICAQGMNEPYCRHAYGSAFLFIDAKGIISKVLPMVTEYQQIEEAATAGNYAGEVRPIPKGTVFNAVDAPRLLVLKKVWNRPAEGVKNIATGDWNGDGKDELIVLGAYQVECIDAAGATVATWAPPLLTDVIRFGKCGREGRILAKTMMGIYVYSPDGKAQWHYDAEIGVDDCCFADAEGTGCDGVLMGLNGDGGLVLFTSEGKEAWKAKGALLGNFWNQAAVRTSKGEAFLLTTSVSGSISRYSAKGKCLTNMRGCGSWVSLLAAAEMDGQGHVQILGWGQDGYVSALNGDGELVWRCRARSSLGDRRDDQLVAGDLDGDGLKEWTVPGVEEILIVSASGQILCHTGVKSAAPALLGRPGKPALFVAGTDTEITAYEATGPVAANPTQN